MARKHCLHFSLPAPWLAAPLLLALGSCAALPIAELASPGLGGSIMTSAMQKVMPGISDAAAPACARGQQANGCDTMLAGTSPAISSNMVSGTNPAISSNTEPGTSPAISQKPAITPEPAVCAPGEDCERNPIDRIVLGLTHSLRQLAPAALLQH